MAVSGPVAVNSGADPMLAPGDLSWVDFTLMRVLANDQVAQWYDDFHQGGGTEDLQLELKNQAGDTVAVWLFNDAWPAAYFLTHTDGDMREVVRIVNQGFVRSQ